MKSVKSIILAVVLVFAFSSLCFGDEIQYGDFRISGPYEYENLTVFFLHGQDLIAAEDLVPLGPALEDGNVIVHETGNVQELTIENISDRPVFIHAGDIVKGGRQDRVIRVDVILKPHSGKRPISSFCVEHGRWSQRGDENAGEFESSPNMIATKDLKIAAKVEESQSEVWSKVSNAQEALAYNVGTQVKGSSPSSLQLTLENDKIKETTRGYIDAITSELENYDNVIGYVFAINGEINSADIYRSHDLFARLWPKLIEACAIEAVSVLNQEANTSLITANDIAEWLNSAKVGESEKNAINDRTDLNTIRGDEDILFETTDKENGKYIHINILKR